MQFSKRKWGWYLTLLSDRYFKVKLLYFRKHGQISLQRHEHRDETWCFLFGEGNLTRHFNDQVEAILHAQKGDSYIIPKRDWHHYKAHKPTLVLEVQSGGRCDEEDIIRA